MMWLQTRTNIHDKAQYNMARILPIVSGMWCVYMELEIFFSSQQNTPANQLGKLSARDWVSNHIQANEIFSSRDS